MAEELYIEHATLFVADSDEKGPGNRWSPRHSQQGFARRRTAINIATVFPEDGYVSDVVHGEDALPQCEKVLEFSLFSASGKIVLSGTDPVEIEIWRGEPGWVRMTVGQQLLEEGPPPKVRLTVAAAPATADAPTRVWLGGSEVKGEFLEEAEEQRV